MFFFYCFLSWNDFRMTTVIEKIIKNTRVQTKLETILLEQIVTLYTSQSKQYNQTIMGAGGWFYVPKVRCFIICREGRSLRFVKNK